MTTEEFLTQHGAKPTVDEFLSGGMSPRPYSESSPFASIGGPDDVRPDVSTTPAEKILKGFLLPQMGQADQEQYDGPTMSQAPISIPTGTGSIGRFLGDVPLAIRTDDGLKPYGNLAGVAGGIIGHPVEGASMASQFIGEGIGYASATKLLKLAKLGPVLREFGAGLVKGSIRPDATVESVGMETLWAGALPALSRVAGEVPSGVKSLASGADDAAGTVAKETPPELATGPLAKEPSGKADLAQTKPKITGDDDIVAQTNDMVSRTDGPLTQANVATARAERGVSDIELGKPIKIAELRERVSQTNYAATADDAINRINNRVDDEAAYLTKEEEMSLTIRDEDLKKSYESAAAKHAEFVSSGDDIGASIANNEMLRLADELDKLERAGIASGSQAGLTLRLIRGEIGEFGDEPLYKIVKGIESNRKMPLTNDELAHVTKTKQEIDALRSQVDDLTKKEVEWQAERERILAEKTIAHEKKIGSITAKSDKVRVAITESRNAAKDKLRELGYRVNEAMSVSAEASYHIGQIAVSYIREGATTLKEVADKVMADIPSITERDVWDAINARNPKVIAKQRSVIDKKVSHLKTVARLSTQVEDALNGILPESGARTIVPDDIRSLQKKLRDIVKEASASYGSGDRLARLQEIVNRLDDQLENRFRYLKKKKGVGAPNELELKRQASELRSLLKIDDEMADLTEQLRTGEFKSRIPRRRQVSPELQDKQIELRNLRSNFAQYIAENTPQNAWQTVVKSINTLRTAQATADVSATLRQGLVLSIANPKEAVYAQTRALRSMFDKKSADKYFNEMVNSGEYKLFTRHGGEVSVFEKPLGHREEMFMNGYLENVPVVKNIVHGSERHMATYLNELRMASFKNFANAVPNATKQELSAIADYINAATGKGDISFLGKSSNAMQALFFAPRFAVSRFQTPYKVIKYWDLPRVRKAVATDLGKTIGAGMTMLTLAKYAGADVSADPRSSDFGKIKIGNTRLDIWGGFQQPARLIAEFGTEVGSQAGWVDPIKGRSYNPIESMARFASYKGSPIVGLAYEMATGKDVVGRKLPDNIGLRALDFAQRSSFPIFLREVYDTYKQEGIGTASLTAPLSALGIGVSTYKKKQQPFTFSR